MKYILLSLIILLAIAFIVWGIYQIRTGKMVAKNAKFPIDEPREVGVVFLCLGIFGLFPLCFLIPITWVVAWYGSSPTPPLPDYPILNLISMLVFSLPFFVLLFFFIKSLKNERIFGVKSDNILRPLIKRYYCITDLGFIIATLFFPVAYIFSWCENLRFLSGPCAVISVLGLFIGTYCLMKIESEYKKHSKHTKPAKKSTRKSKKNRSK